MANWPLRLVLGVLTVIFSVSLTRAEEGVVLAAPLEAESNAYPDGTFGEQLAAASSGGGGPVGGSPYRSGPGRRDEWDVGPHWRATVDGVVLYRGDARLNAILAEVEPIDPSTTLPPLAYRDNFDHAAGVRALLTADYPQCAGYELQVGYLGVGEWLANAYWDLETIPAASLPDSDVDVFQQRQLTYSSSLNAVEVNFQRSTRDEVKPFVGLRYIAFDETIRDSNRQFTNVILGEPDMIGDTLSEATQQTTNSVLAKNDLIGFHGGLRVDMWRPHRKVHLNGFFSGGVYCNIIGRDRVFRETTSITTNELVSVSDPEGGDPTEEVQTTTNSLTTTTTVSAGGTRVAYSAEASLALTWRIASTSALRAGYQVFFLDQVQLAEDLWLSPPPITPVEDDLFTHGWYAGLEYRR